MTEKPVFIFAASWRTGSTLLQRVLNSTGNILIWGEPTHLNEMRKLNADLHGYYKTAEPQYQAIEREGIEHAWTPIFSPKPEYVNPAFKAMLDGLYKTAANALGYDRWGFKEVRINAFENAVWLKELYPHAKFIFHYRDPYSMFESVQKTDFHTTFSDPYEPIRAWKNNVKNVLIKQANRAGRRTDKPEFFIVKHEDLMNSETVRRLVDGLFNHLELEYDFDKVTATLGHNVGGSKQKSKLTEGQVSTINEILGPEILGAI